MKLNITMSFALLAVLPIFGEPKGWINPIFEVQGETYRQRCIEIKDDSYPVWTPDKPSCPLNYSNALSIATKAASKTMPKIEQWKTQSISLIKRAGVIVKPCFFLRKMADGPVETERWRGAGVP